MEVYCAIKKAEEKWTMQIRAILSAASELKKEKKIEVEPEIMIPFIMSEKEFILRYI